MTPRRLARGLAVALSCLLTNGCVDWTYDHLLNRVEDAPRPTPTAEERKFHDDLFIADLHADTLMWDRDLLSEHGYGHIDLPRLQRGNVRLQVFSVVTKTPIDATEPRAGMSCYDGDDIDSAALLSVMQLRNPSGWFSLEGRALDQARRLHEFAREANARADADPSYPGLRIVKTLGDLRDVVESRKGPRYLIGAVLSLEGVHWLGDPGLTDTAIAAGVRRLYDAGFRVLALTHQFDNGLADASEGCRFAGERAVPTEAGRVVIREAERLGMIIDLAHAASRTIKGVLAVARNPVVVSHTGVRETCPVAEGCSPRRNIADDDIRGIAQRGGVIGIGYWTEAVGAGIAGIVRAQRHVIDVLGPAEACRHLAFGSDFDGSVSMPFDAVALPELTAAMRRSFSSAPGPGCGDSRGLRLIAGANVCRIFAMRLPLGSLAEADRSTICASLEN